MEQLDDFKHRIAMLGHEDIQVRKDMIMSFYAEARACIHALLGAASAYDQEVGQVAKDNLDILRHLLNGDLES